MFRFWPPCKESQIVNGEQGLDVIIFTFCSRVIRSHHLISRSLDGCCLEDVSTTEYSGFEERLGLCLIVRNSKHDLIIHDELKQ